MQTDKHLADDIDHSEDVLHSDPFFVFRSRKNLSEPHLKQAQIILAAITDVVKPNTTPVAYFGALMTALQQLQQSGSDDSLTAMLYLLGMLFPSIPANVLKSKFEEIAKVLLGLLEAGSNAEDAQIARPLLTCIGILLQSQELAVMTHRTAVQCFQALLIYAVDPRPKVRKAAQHSAAQVTESIAGALYLSRNSSSGSAVGSGSGSGAAAVGFPKQLADGVRDLTLRELAQCTARDCDVALHLLSGYLSQCLPLLPRATVVAPICHAVLALCRALSANSILHLQTMRCLQAFFENAGPMTLESNSVQHAKEFQDNLQFIDTLLGSLLEQAPNPNEAQASIAFFKAVQAALLRLADPSAFSPIGVTSGKRFASFFSQLTSDYLTSHKFEVVDAATSTATQLLRSCLHIKMAQHTATNASAEPTPIESIIASLQGLLGYRYKGVWNQAFRIIDAGMESLGKLTASSSSSSSSSSSASSAALIGIVSPLLQSLGELHESDDLVQDKSVRVQLETAVGTAIAKFGPEVVVSVLPLELPGSQSPVAALSSNTQSFDQQLTKSRAWLLPLMQDRINQSELGFFWDHLHPVLTNLHVMRTAAQQENAPIRARAILALMEQIWATFPSFCRLPTDVAASFKLMAKSLGTSLSSVSHSYAWPSICKGLHDLTLACAPEPDDEDDEDGDDGDELSKASDSDEEDENPFASKGKGVAKGAKQAFDARSTTSSHKSGKSTQSRASQRSAARMATWNAKPKILRYTDTDAAANQAVLSPFAKNFLPIFFNLVEKVAPEKRQMVLDTISAYAAIADEKLLNSTFKNILKMLLQTSVASSSASSATADSKPTIDMAQLQKVHMLSDIAYSLCDRLDAENTEWLYKTVLPQLRDADPRLQKKSYKTLARLCSSHRSFLATHVEELTTAFSDALSECAAGSKKSRLRCLRTLVQNLPSLSDARVVQAMPILLGEVILSVKELSERSRAVAYDVLLSMADRMRQAEMDSDEADGDDAAGKSAEELFAPSGKANLREFFLMVVGGLAGTSQHMKSGTVLAISRLMYEFADELPTPFALGVVETVCMLLKEKSREVVKSVLGFCKVILVTLPPERLRPHLKLIVEGLLLWCKEAQSRFRQKTRTMLTILMRRFGMEDVLQYVPEDLQKWLLSISKQERRSAKKKAAAKQAEKDQSASASSSSSSSPSSSSGIRKPKSFEEAIRVDEDDYQDHDEFDSDDDSGGNGKRAANNQGKKNARVWLRDEADADAVDLLDPSMARHVMTSNPNSKKRGGAAAASSASMFSMDEKGRMVIPKELIEEDSDEDSGNARSSAKGLRGREDFTMDQDSDDEVVAVGGGKVSKQKKRNLPEDDDSMGMFSTSSSSSSSSSAAAASDNADAGDQRKPFFLSKKAQQRQDDKERQQKRRKENQIDGSMYRSTKAAGDMKVKGRPDPYAFLPLDPSMLNRRNKNEAVHQFDNIVRAAHKGSVAGATARDKWKKSNKRH